MLKKLFFIPNVFQKLVFAFVGFASKFLSSLAPCLKAMVACSRQEKFGAASSSKFQFLKHVRYILFFCATLEGGLSIERPYIGPTETFIEREGWDKILKKLQKQKIDPELVTFFNQVAEKEDWGHIGYHGANYSYRIYQDIIKITFEEILGIPIREDFHFLRVPGDADLKLNSMEEFIAYWGKKNVNNRKKIRAKQLLSLNFSVYSNYDSTHSSSVLFFAKNKSSHNINYIKTLELFYRRLGISQEVLPKLFAIADKRLEGHKGLLLQISENSHWTDPYKEAYNFADRQCYAAKPRGDRYSASLISKEYENAMSDLYRTCKANMAPQLRLLMNNQNTLNPFSHLVVKRWDLLDPDKVEVYEKELREAIQRLSFSLDRVENYKKRVLKEWTSDFSTGSI